MEDAVIFSTLRTAMLGVPLLVIESFLRTEDVVCFVGFREAFVFFRSREFDREPRGILMAAQTIGVIF